MSSNRTSTSPVVTVAVPDALYLDVLAELATLREAAPAAKAAKPTPLCACGCGVETAGGRFRPGHDAKLKGALIKAVRATTSDAAFGTAWAALEGNGWAHLFDREVEELTAKANRIKARRA